MNNFPLIHKDKKNFVTALNQAAGEYGFRSGSIEKDYYCTLILNLIFNKNYTNIIFKGGTCLNKVYAGFYRLSEDLDFCISIDENTTRNKRRQAINPIKKIIDQINSEHIELNATSLQGHNDSRQYISQIKYESLVTGSSDSIKLEISLRENVIDPPIKQKANTLLTEPFSGENFSAMVACLTLYEAYAEKTRAALTRLTPAIRDYYDLWYAHNKKIINFKDKKFIEYASKKSKILGNKKPEVSIERINMLNLQLETELQPVLRMQDYSEFNLDNAVKLVDEIFHSLPDFP